MPRILAIDPGPSKSAWLVWDTATKRIDAHFYDDNADLLRVLPQRPHEADMLAVEMVASFGMAVGKEVFETVFWIGRFVQAWRMPFARVYRMQVKMHLCHNSRAKDANIRQAILDRFGGRDAALGKKNSPGPLYGVSGDRWSALAVALTYSESPEFRCGVA